MGVASLCDFKFASFLVVLYFLSAQSATTPCFDKSETVKAIPDNHLYSKKQKPLVIGHHGNPSEFQENTVDGFKSLVSLKADGMEFDTFLTKDSKLVVIHFDNTQFLTGASHNIWDITYEELHKLNIKSKLTYGNKEYEFDKTRKIPLLSDVVDAVKDAELVMYLNMKPGYIRNRTESERIGKAVAKLIGEKGVADKVLLSSFDPFKILAAKRENPSLAVGMFYKTGMWTPSVANNMKIQFADLPKMRECVKKAPNGTDFMNFVFQTGDVLKSTDSSFVVMDYNIYNNPQFSNDTFKTFEENYRPSLSFGAFIIDNLALTDEQRKSDEKKLDLLIEKKAAALFTDDIPRLRQKLGRNQAHRSSSTSKNFPPIVVQFAMLLAGCFLRY